jgi:uncharacterized protein
MNATLLSLLACPRCQGPLHDSPMGDVVICPAESLAYPVEDGIPMLLPEQGRPLTSLPQS